MEPDHTEDPCTVAGKSRQVTQSAEFNLYREKASLAHPGPGPGPGPQQADVESNLMGMTTNYLTD